MDDIVYISDVETYELLYLNRVGKERLGIQEYEGCSCYQILQNNAEPCSFCNNERLCCDRYYIWEFTNPKIHRHYILRDKLIMWNGRKARMEICEDITDRENLSESTLEKLHVEETLVHCIRDLTDECSLEITMQRILKVIGEFYRANRAYVFEFDGEREVFNNTYEWCAPTVRSQIERLQQVPLATLDRWMDLFSQKGEVYITSLSQTVAHDTDEYHILAAQGIQTLMAAPLLDGERVIGFIGVDDPTQRLGHVELLQSLAFFVRTFVSQRRVTEQLRYLSYTDQLTGLGNRNSYRRILQELEQRPLRSLGVISLDLNGLRAINKTYGHDYGDLVIRKVAQVLQRHFDSHLFRIGGDEFVVLCVDVPRQSFEERVNAARQEYDAMEECSVSLGVTWQDTRLELTGLLKYADELMSANKQRFYKTSRGMHSRHNFTQLQKLLADIEQERYVVYLQPIVALQDGAAVGCEALVRKKAPQGGIIPPYQFIPMLEAEKLIRHIDFFVLEEVCRTLCRWREQERPLLPVSVNFSRVTLMENTVVQEMAAICKRYDIPTSYIDIEVTESIGQMDGQQLQSLTEALSEAGFSLSLDDFGSQYSNLSMLTTLDFDYLKLDKSLIDHIEENPRSRAVARRTVELCGDLPKMRSVAEGIENQRQLEILQRFRCDCGQGYLFAKPMPISDFEQRYLQPVRVGG